MTKQDTRTSVFMVVSANMKNGMPDIPSFVRSRVDSLRDAGWEVILGVVDDRTSVKGILRNIRRLRREIGESRVGLVHAEYGSVNVAIAHLIRGRLPLVVSFWGDDLLGTPNPGFVWRIRERCARFMGIWASRHAASIMVMSNNLLQALPIRMRDRGIILPHGIDSDWFQPMDREICRAKLGWTAQSKVVLFNASKDGNQAVKNPALAHEVMKILSQVIPDVTLKTMSCATREEVRLMMNAADCLLVTSLHEGSPNIVKEAMSCNLPVVTTPCGDVGERLAQTHPGSVRSYNARALADAIQEVFKSGSRSNGREQLMAQGQTVSAIGKRLIQIYRYVQNENSRITKKGNYWACVE